MNIKAQIWFLIFYNAMAMLITGMIGPIMPLYLQSRGFPIAMLGIIIAIAGFTSAILSLFFGNLSEKYDKRNLFLVSSVCYTLLPILYIFAKGTPEFVILQVAEGIIGPLAGIASGALLLDKAKESGKRGAVMGKARTFKSSMTVLGPAIGGFIITKLAIKNIFWIETIILGLSTILVVLILKKVKPTEKQTAPLFSLPTLLKDKVVICLLILLFLDFMNFQSLITIFPLFGHSHGLSYKLIGILITVQSLAYAMLQYPVGKLTDAGKMIPIMCVCVLIHGPLIWSLSIVHNVALMYVIMALIGFASAPVFLAVMILLSEAAGKNTGIAMGLISSVVYLSSAVGPMFATLLSSLEIQYGFFVPVVSSVVSIPLSLTVIFWSKRNSLISRDAGIEQA